MVKEAPRLLPAAKEVCLLSPQELSEGSTLNVVSYSEGSARFLAAAKEVSASLAWGIFLI